MQIIFIPKGKSEDLMTYPIDQLDSMELEETTVELSELDPNYQI